MGDGWVLFSPEENSILNAARDNRDDDRATFQEEGGYVACFVTMKYMSRQWKSERNHRSGKSVTSSRIFVEQAGGNESGCWKRLPGREGASQE